MSLPAEVISGPFAESVVVSDHLCRITFSSSTRSAYSGESLASSSNSAEYKRTTFGHLQEQFRTGFSIARRCSHEPLLQALSCHRLGSRGSRGVRFIRRRSRACQSSDVSQKYAVSSLDNILLTRNLASSPLYYVTALTALFESIAMIVDHHQPVVDKYYGAGKMIIVIKRLLDECDRVVRSTLDSWREERSMKRKVKYFIWLDRMMILRPSPVAFRCNQLSLLCLTFHFPQAIIAGLSPRRRRFGPSRDRQNLI